MTYEEALRFAECLKNNWTINFSDMEDFCNIATECINKQIYKKPRKTETIYGVDGCGEVTNKLILYTCPACDEPIHVGRGCSNNECRQAIDWGKD